MNANQEPGKKSLLMVLSSRHKPAGSNLIKRLY